MLPVLFVERMREVLGEEAEAFLKRFEEAPFQALRLNPMKTTAEEFLGKVPFRLSPVPWEKNGFYYEKEDQPGKHPFHEAGVYYIQEPSAMLPAGLLGAQPGEKVLDLCGAPGGKSTQLAAAMKGEGILICNEIHPARARILSENVERMGVRNALVTNEAPGRLAEEFPDYFDRILVDAPCSGEGMFRKNAEAVEEWSPENVALCADRQDGILDCAAAMLRPGGRLVYSTCTFERAEDEEAVERFLQRHGDFRLLDAAELQREKWPDGALSAAGCQLEQTVRIWPHRTKGEGHFAAVLQKEAGEQDIAYRSASVHGLQKGIPPRDCGEYFAFAEEYLNRPLLGEGIYLAFGDQLYLAPPQTPSLKGLKVLRPGLHLGTMKKNRFEPSHGLALTLSPGQVKQSYELDPQGREVQDYLNGLTFPAQGEKGWYLITTGGYSCGWGKLAGGMMKNHYPRGLRK